MPLCVGNIFDLAGTGVNEIIFIEILDIFHSVILLSTLELHTRR